MKEQFEVTFTGTGQLNGPVPINKTVIYDAEVARGFQGSQRDEAIADALAVFFPGVQIETNRISINIKKVEQPKEKKSKKIKKKKPLKETKEEKIETSRQTKTEKPSKEKAQSEQPKKDNEIKNLLVNTGKSILSDFQEKKNEKKEKEKYYTGKKNEVINLPTPTEKNEIIDFINNMILRIKADMWQKNDTIKNQYADICFERLKHIVNQLKLSDKEIDIKEYEKQIKKLKWTRIFKKNFNK